MARIETIQADKERNIKFGVNSLTELEQDLGVPLLSKIENGAELTLTELRLFFFHGLKWEDKKLTLTQAGDIMDEAIDKMGYRPLNIKIGEALGAAFGASKPPSK